jgi:hypothetical protein
MLEKFAEAVFAYSFATMNLPYCLPGGAGSLYASSAASTDNARAVVDGMRTKAEGIKQSNPHAAALFENVAQGIELYIGLKPLNP